MNKEYDDHSNKIIFIVLLVLVFISLLINIINNTSINAPGILDSDYGENLDIEFDIYANGNFVTTSTLPYFFPETTKNKQIDLIANLPSDKFIDTSSISFRVSGYSIKAQLDGNEIYNFYKEDVKDYGGGYWHFIKLPENSSSKQIKISLFTPIGNPFSQKLSPIYIGSKGYLLKQAFGSSFESLFFGTILIVFGLVFLGNIIFTNRSLDTSFLLSLSILLICLGSWVIFQSPSRQIFGINNPTFPMVISFFTMSALPYSIWFYINTNYNNFEKYIFIKYYAYSIFFLYVIISIITLNSLNYTSFLALMGFLILLYIAIVFVVSIKIYIRGERKILSCIFAIASILISIISEEVLLILKIKIEHISILHTGMAIAAIIFIYQSISNLIEKTTEDNEAKLLKKLAYLDIVTLVNNRNSYESFIESESNQLDSCGIILADINGLKLVNDMIGHKGGDELLKNLSKRLKDEMPKNSKLYRVGGDEFIGIILSQKEKEFSKFINNLQKKFIPTEQDLGIAIGSYYYIKKRDISFSNAIDKADQDMYKHKKNQKSLIHKYFLDNGYKKESSLIRD